MNITAALSHLAQRYTNAVKRELLPARTVREIGTIEGKPLRDDETLKELKLPARGAQLYIRDLGPQIGWVTVRKARY